MTALDRLLDECEHTQAAWVTANQRARKLARIVRVLRDHIKECNTEMDNRTLAEAEKIAGEG